MKVSTLKHRKQGIESIALKNIREFKGTHACDYLVCCLTNTRGGMLTLKGGLIERGLYRALRAFFVVFWKNPRALVFQLLTLYSQNSVESNR